MRLRQGSSFTSRPLRRALLGYSPSATARLWMSLQDRQRRGAEERQRAWAGLQERLQRVQADLARTEAALEQERSLQAALQNTLRELQQSGERAVELASAGLQHEEAAAWAEVRRLEGVLAGQRARTRAAVAEVAGRVAYWAGEPTGPNPPGPQTSPGEERPAASAPREGQGAGPAADHGERRLAR